MLKEWLRAVARKRGYAILRDRIGLDAPRDLEQLAAGARVIFDVGANVGQTATQLAALFPDADVLSFEPDPEVFATLQKNTAALPRVSSFPIALSDEDASRKLFVAQSSVGSSLLPLATDVERFNLGDWAEQRGEKPVEVRRLDSFCRERGLGSIDLLKSDTQGAEMKVFGGAGEMLEPSTIRAIFCEVLFLPLYSEQAFFEDVHRLLTSRGYRLVGLYNEFRDHSHRLMWCDALYTG